MPSLEYLLCGYLGEKVGWSWGFGLAGIFMLFGLLQFWLAQNIFGDIGLKPVKKETSDVVEKVEEVTDNDKRNPFATWQLVVIGVSTILGLSWIINDPVSKISEGELNLFGFLGDQGNNIAILTAIGLFVILMIYRITQYSKITKEK